MIRKQYNWKPVVKSFFDIAQKAGFEATHVDDGGGEGYEDITKRAKTQADRKAVAIQMVCDVDECRVNFVHMPTGKDVAALFVLGNGAEEICANWTISNNPDTAKTFEDATDEFYSEWEHQKVPMVEVETNF